MAVIDFEILYIPDPTKGRPLFSGQVHVGEPDLDPVTNPKQLNVVQEDGTVVPVDQPFILSAGGVPVYNGSPVRLSVDGDYSLKILDRLGSQIYFIERVAEFGLEQTINYYDGDGAWDGLTGVLLNVPDRPIGLTLVIDGDTQEKGVSGDVNDFLYDRATGNITLTVALTGNEQVFVIYGAIVPITATKPSGLQTFATVNEYVTDLNNEIGDKVQTYFYNAKVLCNWTTVAAGTGAGDMSDGTLNLTGSSLQAQLVIEPVMTPKHFSGFGGGSLDDTIPVNNCLSNSPFSLIDVVYGVTQISAPNYFTTTDAGEFKYIGTRDLTMLSITASEFGTVKLDCNAISVTPVQIVAGNGKHIGDRVQYRNMLTDDVTPGSVAAFRCFGDIVEIPSIIGTDLTSSGGNSNDSIPQGIVTGNGRYNLDNLSWNNARSGLVTTGGVTVVGTNTCKNMADNGAYLLGGDVRIDNHIYEGTEESCVISGAKNVVVNSITTIGRCINTFNWQGTVGDGSIHIGKISSLAPEGTATADIKSNVALVVATARSGNVDAGNIYIGNIEGDFAQGVFLTGSNTASSLTVGGGNINVHYSPTANPNWDISNWLNFSGVDRLNIKNLDIKIIDDEGALTSAPFTIITKTYTEQSSIENLDVTFLNPDGTVNGTGVYHGGRPQSLLTYKGALWNTLGGAGPHAREVTFRSGQRDTMESTLPLVGTWPAGTDFGISNPTVAGPTRIRTITGGTPGPDWEII